MSSLFLKHIVEHGKTFYDRITFLKVSFLKVSFLKILTNQNKQIKALTAGTRGLNLSVKWPVVMCIDFQIWYWAHPWHFWGFGQEEYKRRPTYSVSEYFKVINHVNKRLDKICYVLLPEQLFLHNEQEARFEFRFLGLCPRTWLCRGLARPDSISPSPSPLLEPKGAPQRGDLPWGG